MIEQQKDDPLKQKINTSVTEDMDDSTEDNISTLIAAAQAFIEYGLIYDSRVYGEGPEVKVAIKKFVANNPAACSTANQIKELSTI